MQSLKIIIFRDTDKPYTMIISSGVLVGIAFSIVTLMSLLTFSVMSNVMFYNDGQQGPTLMAAASSQEQESQPTEDLTDDTISDDVVSDDEEGYQDGGANDTVAEETNEETIDDQRANVEEDVSEPAGTETRSSETNSLTTITPYMPTDGEVEAFLLQDAIISSDSIRIRAQIQKRLNLGVSYRGRFCAALVDTEGNIGPSYPRQVTFEGFEVLNPERSNTFRIAYRRNYDFTFNIADAQNYSAIVFYIFDEETKTLQWRNAVPLTR